MPGQGYYTHPFMVVGAQTYCTKTAACLLKVASRVSNGRTECVMRVKIGRTVTAFPEAVEGPLFSSSFSIEHLDNVVRSAHSAASMAREKGDIPCIINWAEVSTQGGRKHTVYIIYAEIGDEQPWVVASFSSKYVGIGRVSFLAIVPNSIGLNIQLCQENDRDLVFEVY